LQASHAAAMQPTKYGPKSRSSPSIGAPCPLCGVAFAAGDFTGLMARTREDRYANDAVEAHWDCIVDPWPKGTGGETAARLDPDALVGKVIDGKYRVEEKLGSGSMGIVFRARHTRLLRQYAIKVLHPRLLSDPKLRQRFALEAELAARLSHPNVIGVTDMGDFEGHAFIVMDLGTGPTLGNLLEEGPFDPLRACRLIRQLCDGLAHAHARGLIHRDLKPDNVVVESCDGNEVARIADFGIAILRESVGSPGRLTTSGLVVGTPHYMSPEMSTGSDFDHRLDLFALGVICYEMLTGQKPYLGGTAMEVLQQHVSAPLPVLPPDLSRYEPFTRRLLAKARGERFVNAAEIIAAATALLPAAAGEDHLGETGGTGAAQPSAA
jgi:serine/threonine protein kinase